jgi:hypothetical protein
VDDLLPEVQRLFGAPLATMGFELHTVSPSSWAYRVVTSDGPPRYVKLEATLDPRDQPWQLTVRLGEGSLEWPEVDWNGLPLWVLVEEQSGTTPRYRYDHPAGIPAALSSAAPDLFRYAGDFLNGEVQTFRRQRAKLNETREPYVRQRSDGSGPEALPESIELKRRFSVE